MPRQLQEAKQKFSELVRRGLTSGPLVHGLTVVTRNVADFEPAGVAIPSPFEG
jgi:hypothetical protein